VLCLASGGGQQGPVLAAAGADVTVFDNSPRQLARDEEVAARDGLAVRTVLGDMRDLSAFADARFDLVFNPVSNTFCPDLAPVWRECFRVLRPGGLLLTGFTNPDLYIFDTESLDAREELVVRHRIPFSTLDLPEADRQRTYGDGPIEYSHTLTAQIGGQLAAGFVLTHLTEAPHHADVTAQYMPGYFATRAVRPSRPASAGYSPWNSATAASNRSMARSTGPRGAEGSQCTARWNPAAAYSSSTLASAGMPITMSPTGRSARERSSPTRSRMPLRP
jgi:SAM-dependent methyltransferase